MKNLVLVGASLIMIFVALTFSASILYAQNNVLDKIHPWVIEHTSKGQQAEFMVHLKERPDLSQALLMPDKESKVRFVYETLLEAANRSQASLRKYLEERNIKYQWFYTTNALLVKGL